MKISFVGAGRVGGSLGRYFQSRGFQISGFFDLSKGNAKNASQITNSCCFESYKDLLDSSDLIFITVPDGIIKTVWSDLLKNNVSEKYIAHASGSLSTEVFEGAGEKGCKVLSMHPMMTFPGMDTDIDMMEKMPLTIEGEIDSFSKFLDKLPNNKFSVLAELKANYHLAGVFASNLLIPVIHRAMENIKKAGLPNGEEIIFPIIEKTIGNIKLKGIPESVTGPLERGDVETVSKHLEVQEENEKSLYIHASLELLDILKDRERDYSEIRKKLEEER